MKNIFAARIKRLVSGVAAAAITVSAIPVMPAMAAATENTLTRYLRLQMKMVQLRSTPVIFA